MQNFKQFRSFFLIGLLVILFSQPFNAQNTDGKICRSEEQMELLYQANPTSRIEQSSRSQLLNTSEEIQRRDSGVSYVIPVVFHVFGTTFNSGVVVTDAIIQDALIKTNEDFKGLNFDYPTVSAPFDAIKTPLDVTFKLAQLDPLGNPTNGIIYYPEAGGMGNFDSPIVPRVAWDNSKYMNVYITRDLYNDGDYYNSGVAWLPDTYMTNNNIARVVYNGSYLGTNTNENFRSVLTHEFGHFLDLHHTFKGGICNDDPLDGDEVADTPSHINSSSGTNCQMIYNCLNQQINHENFMDYTDCYKMFTGGQVDRMVNALENSPARNTLWTASNLTATGLNFELGPRVTANNSVFEERYLNDGVVESVIELTAIETTFTLATGVYQEGLHYMANNVPVGMEIKISALNSTTVIVTLEGTAENHATINTVSDLEIVFLDPMIQGGVGLLYSDMLNNLVVNFNDDYTEACQPSIGYSGYTYISNVTFDGRSNETINNYYSDYTNTLSYPVLQGGTYPLSVTTNRGNGGDVDNLRIQIWIDWNSNFIFEDSELTTSHAYINQDTDENGDYVYTTDIQVQPDADLGNIAIRIMAHYVSGTDGDSSCSYIDSGEVEDYGVSIYDENTALSIGFSGVPQMVNFSDPVSFTDLSVAGAGDSITSWLWTFEGADTPTSTDQNPENIYYLEEGEFDVTLTVTTLNGNGETLTKPNYISAELKYCETAPNFGSYFSVNKVQLESIDHNPGLSNYYDYYDSVNTNLATGTTYPITITSELGNGSLNDYNSVKVWADWNFDSQFTENELLIDKIVSNEDYDENGLYTFTSDILVPYDAAAGKKVGLRIIGHYVDGFTGPCGNFDSGNAIDYGINIVEGISGITAWATPSYEEFSFNDTLVFTDQSSSSSAITTWNWTFEGGTPSTFEGQYPPEISYGEPDLYTYSLTVTNDDGQTDTFTGGVSAIVEYCETTPAYGTYFNVNNVELGTINHTPDLNNYYNYYNSVFTDLEAGQSYPITISTEPGNGGESDINRVRVWADWNFDSQFSEDELIVSRNVAFSDYVNDAFEFTENITVPLDAAIGNKVGLRIIGHYVDGSGGETACGVFDSGNALDYGLFLNESSLGVPDLEDFQIKVYPNPVQSTLYIKTKVQEAMSLEIFNSLGQKVLHQTFDENLSLIEVPLENFSNGLYYIKGRQNQKVFTKKIIIKQ